MTLSDMRDAINLVDGATVVFITENTTMEAIDGQWKAKAATRHG